MFIQNLTLRTLSLSTFIRCNELPRGRAIGVSTRMKVLKNDCMLLLPTPNPLQRGFIGIFEYLLL